MLYKNIMRITKYVFLISPTWDEDSVDVGESPLKSIISAFCLFPLR